MKEAQNKTQEKTSEKNTGINKRELNKNQPQRYSKLFLNKDCRHFIDYKPCKPHKKFGVTCESCPYYEKTEKKILIINLEAIGDVLRTTAILKPLKEKYKDCSITWLTTEKASYILNNNPYVNKVLSIGYEASLQLMIEEFDLVLNYDKAHEACALATIVKAKEKKGFVLGNDGMIKPIDDAAKYFLDIGISDKLKRLSQKTQQEIVFDITGIPYNHEHTILNLPKEAVKFADAFFKKHKFSEKDIVVGFNTGCSNRLFLDRKWTIDGFVQLASMLHEKLGAKIMLLGGPNEAERNKEIMQKIMQSSKAVVIIDSGSNNTLDEFSALLEKCSLLVTGDTLAVHIAAALDVPVAAIFGNVLASEIELYGKGRKIQTDMECWGCYKYKCEFQKTCMERIKAATVFNAVEDLLKEKGLL